MQRRKHSRNLLKLVIWTSILLLLSNKETPAAPSSTFAGWDRVRWGAPIAEIFRLYPNALDISRRELWNLVYGARVSIDDFSFAGDSYEIFFFFDEADHLNGVTMIKWFKAETLKEIDALDGKLRATVKRLEGEITERLGQPDSRDYTDGNWPPDIEWMRPKVIVDAFAWPNSVTSDAVVVKYCDPNPDLLNDTALKWTLVETDETRKTVLSRQTADVNISPVANHYGKFRIIGLPEYFSEATNGLSVSSLFADGLYYLVLDRVLSLKLARQNHASIEPLEIYTEVKPFLKSKHSNKMDISRFELKGIYGNKELQETLVEDVGNGVYEGIGGGYVKDLIGTCYDELLKLYQGEGSRHADHDHQPIDLLAPSGS